LRAKRSNLVVNLFKHYGIASSLTLLAMTAKEAFFNSLLISKTVSKAIFAILRDFESSWQILVPAYLDVLHLKEGW